MMKFFIDTANVEEVKKANDMGVLAGVTTNPSLIAKEGRDYMTVLKEITEIVDGAISGEVKATTIDAEGMIKEGREIAKIHPNMVVKIPMTAEGLKASMPLFQPRHFIMPFLAHALGTFVGAFIAASIAATHKMKLALGIGVLFLIGGITNVLMLPSPLLFSVIDLAVAYIPMAYIGGMLAVRRAAALDV